MSTRTQRACGSPTNDSGGPEDHSHSPRGKLAMGTLARLGAVIRRPSGGCCGWRV